jgi:hypothetical protein
VSAISVAAERNARRRGSFIFAGKVVMAARIARAALLAFAVLALQGMARGQVPANEIVTFHGLTFPAAIAGAERFSVRDYEKDNPGFGHSVGYRQPGMVTTVYVYDLKKPEIPDNPAAPAIKAEFESARAEILWAQRQGVYSRVEPIDEFSIADAHGSARLVCAGVALAYADHPGERVSYLCLGGWKSKFVKFRATMEQRSQADARGFLEPWTALLWPS